MQSLRVLFHSGYGVGIPVLRIFYFSIVRSITDYAAPVLPILGKGRINIIELLQDKGMEIGLGYQRNAMINVMRLELNYQIFMLEYNQFILKVL